MLLHFVPRVFSYFGSDEINSHPGSNEINLEGFSCDELGLYLGKDDFRVCHPYPNKNIFAACRKMGSGPVNGFFVKAAEIPSEFTTTLSWKFTHKTLGESIATHTIKHIVLEKDMDAISEDMLLWLGMSTGLGGFQSRVPDVAKDWTISMAQPSLYADEDGFCCEPYLKMGIYKDTFAGDDDMSSLFCGRPRLLDRHQTVYMHSLEQERILFERVAARRKMPSCDMAFSL